MAGTPKRLAGPAYVSNSAGTNIYNPASGNWALVRHIHLFNSDSSARTVNMYVSSTGDHTGGKELFNTLSIPANTAFDYYCYLAVGNADFITGDASVASKVIVTIEGDLYISSL